MKVKVTYFASWEVKKCVDSFAEKKNSTFGILRPFWIVLEDSSAGTFENFFFLTFRCFFLFFFVFFVVE